MKEGKQHMTLNVLKGCLRTEGNYIKFQSKDTKLHKIPK